MEKKKRSDYINIRPERGKPTVNDKKRLDPVQEEMEKKESLIVCPGSINPDFVIRSDEPFALVNRTVTFSGASSVYAGGKGRNQAIAAKRASPRTEVILVSCVGDDALGKEAIRTLEKEGIGTRHIAVSKRKGTGKCILSLFKGGYQIVGLDLGANTDLTKEDIERAKPDIESAKVLLCQIENTEEATLHALRTAKGAGTFPILNPSLVPKDRRSIRSMLSLTDLLVLNLQEAEGILGRKEKPEAMAGELGKDVPIVVLTLGEQGSIFRRGDDQVRIPARKVREVDTTACGDVFAGALASSVLERIPDLSFRGLQECVRFATAAAALAVTRTGASESAPERENILRALQ